MQRDKERYVQQLLTTYIHVRTRTFKSQILTDPALQPDASREAASENSRQVIGAE